MQATDFVVQNDLVVLTERMSIICVFNCCNYVFVRNTVYHCMIMAAIADVDIIFLSCFFLLLLLFFPRLISAVADWMFTILLHMVWPLVRI